MCGCGLGLNLLSSSLSSWIINWLMLFTWEYFCLRSEGGCTQDSVALCLRHVQKITRHLK